MITWWMAYVGMVSLLLAGAALGVERAAARWGFATRWGWAGALPGAFMIPVAAHWLRPRSAPVGTGHSGFGETDAVPLEIGAVGEMVYRSGVTELLPLLDPPLVTLWVCGSLGMIAAGATSLIRLRREELRWSRAEIAGQAVEVSSDVGPAVLGFVRSRIVVPAWTLEAPAPVQRLIVAHEVEHVRAHDARLVLSSLGLLMLMPWNLPLWWVVHRLRLAVEVDCDARVLRHGADPHAYGTLLLEVGARRSRELIAVTALSEPTTFLERRIEIMTRPRTRGWWGNGLVTLSASAALVVGACAMDQPRMPSGTGPLATEESIGSLPDLAQRPQFTPYDQKPELLDGAEAGAELHALYPPLLREAGVEGTTLLWVFIDERGQVPNTVVEESSGNAELDDAATRFMRARRFAPAQHRGQPVGVWLQLPVGFRSRHGPSAAVPARESSQEPRPQAPSGAPPGAPVPTSTGAPAPSPAPAPVPVPASDRTQPADGPTFTPYDVKPELANRREAAALINDSYPPMLRAAGIGGTAVLWVRIDARGQVTRTMVARSTGEAALDGAAEAVMRQLRFAPARNGGEAVPAWIQLPIVFDPGGG